MPVLQPRRRSPWFSPSETLRLGSKGGSSRERASTALATLAGVGTIGDNGRCSIEPSIHPYSQRQRSGLKLVKGQARALTVSPALLELSQAPACLAAARHCCACNSVHMVCMWLLCLTLPGCWRPCLLSNPLHHQPLKRQILPPHRMRLHVLPLADRPPNPAGRVNNIQFY